MSRIDRRRLLVLAGSAWVVAGCEYGSDPASGIVSGGNVSDLPPGTLRKVEGQPVAVVRDDAGVYAMTLICTHQECDMSDDDEVSFAGLECACHGSRYDANGNVLDGPAEEPLEHYQVTVDASGAIIVNADVVVDSSERVPV